MNRHCVFVRTNIVADRIGHIRHFRYFIPMALIALKKGEFFITTISTFIQHTSIKRNAQYQFIGRYSKGEMRFH